MYPTQRLRYFLLPFLYLAIGGTVTAMLVQRVLNYATTVWLLLLLPMIMVTVFLTVAGLVNVWLSYRTWQDDGLLQHYSQRSLFWLYLRCWAVVMAGLMLGVVYAWMHALVPDYMQTLFGELSIVFYVVCVFLTLAALMSIVLGENLQEIRLRNTQTENQLLKAQLNPHFLYNTLNNIDALIWIDQERASAAVTSLSSLMRYMTYSARQESVSLAEEMQAISRLCDLQRLRMSCPDAVALSLGDASVTDSEALSSSDAIQGLTISPLLLIPLVENCFKHCHITNEPHAICIRLEVKDRKLIFTTDNLVSSEPAEAAASHSQHHGVGLTVLRRRLELLYPGRYTFTTGVQQQRFRTKLTIVC